MDAKISFMHDGMKSLSEALNDFKDEFGLFIDFMEKRYEDHEDRITQLERDK